MQFIAIFSLRLKKCLLSIAGVGDDWMIQLLSTVINNILWSSIILLIHIVGVAILRLYLWRGVNLTGEAIWRNLHCRLILSFRLTRSYATSSSSGFNRICQTGSSFIIELLSFEICWESLISIIIRLRCHLICTSSILNQRLSITGKTPIMSSTSSCTKWNAIVLI